MAKRSMQKKVALLQQKWDGDLKEEDEEDPRWSNQEVAKNRQKAIYEQNPWLEYNMTCSEWYDKIIKPTLIKEAA